MVAELASRQERFRVWADILHDVAEMTNLESDGVAGNQDDAFTLRLARAFERIMVETPPPQQKTVDVRRSDPDAWLSDHLLKALERAEQAQKPIYEDRRKLSKGGGGIQFSIPKPIVNQFRVRPGEVATIALRVRGAQPVIEVHLQNRGFNMDEFKALATNEKWALLDEENQESVRSVVFGKEDVKISFRDRIRSRDKLANNIHINSSPIQLKHRNALELKQIINHARMHGINAQFHDDEGLWRRLAASGLIDARNPSLQELKNYLSLAEGEINCSLWSSMSSVERSLNELREEVRVLLKERRRLDGDS